MSNLQTEMTKVEAAKLNEAIVTEQGNLARVADTLGLAKSTLVSKLERNHPRLLDKARKLRGKKGNERGRPRIAQSVRDKRTVTAAWKKSEQSYAECARLLKIPASSCRELIMRYDLPMPKGKK